MKIPLGSVISGKAAAGAIVQPEEQRESAKSISSPVPGLLFRKVMASRKVQVPFPLNEQKFKESTVSLTKTVVARAALLKDPRDKKNNNPTDPQSKILFMNLPCSIRRCVHPKMVLM